MTDDTPQPLDEWLADAGREYRRKLAQRPERTPDAPKPKKRAQPEREAQVAVVAWLRKAGCIVSAAVNEAMAGASDGGQRARFYQSRARAGVMKGWPDLTVIAPAGRVFFIEMKSAKGKPSAAQVETHAMLRARGQVVIVGRDIWQIQHDLEQAGIVLTRTGWRAPMAESVRYGLVEP